MPYVAGAVLVGFLVSVLWPYIPMLAGIGVIVTIVGCMIEHPIIGISIVVSVYWLDSVYVGWSTVSGDASLEQGGRWCITIRAATIAVVLALLAFIPTLLALVGSAAMVTMIICLERNGTIVKYEAVGNVMVRGPGCLYVSPPPEAYRRVLPKTRLIAEREDVVRSVAQWRRPGFKDPRQKEIERRTRNFMAGFTTKF
jgi:hypothetical protein